MTSEPLINNFVAEKSICYDRSEEFTQGRLIKDIGSLARQLPCCDYIVNLCQNRYYFLTVFGAAIVAGKISLLPPARHGKIVADIIKRYPRTVIFDDGDNDLPGLTAINVREARKPAKGSIGENITVPNIPVTQPVVTAFTSGSTGTPQAHSKPWGILAGTAQKLAKRFGMDNQTHDILATVPSQHMYGLETTILLALQGSARLFTGQPFYPIDIADSLNSRSVLVTTPIHLRAMVKADIGFPSISRIVSATAPLSLSLAKESEKLMSCPLNEIYGCTEGGSIATRATTHHQNWNPLPEMQLITIGNNVILKAPHLPEEITLTDQIRLTHDGFELIGRHEDLLNVGGKRFSLGELNIRLLEINGVIDGFVFRPPTKQDIERPIAFVVSNLPTKEISRMLAEVIDPSFIPRPILHVKKIPRNATGKVARSAVIALYEDHLA